MKIRVKFSKHGEMKFIGHLDMMRYFQKALRRSGLDIRFSEGMSPHMIMSFAAPLGVGLTSDGEYMDIELGTPVSTQEGIERLNECMVDGIRVLDFRQIEEGKAGKGMSLVAAADYTVRMRDPSRFSPDWARQAEAYIRAHDSIQVVKETKKGASLVDIRPHIFAFEARESGLFLRVSAGSVFNLRPELVVQACLQKAPEELEASALAMHRHEVYALSEGTLVPLIALGRVITV